MENQCIKYCTSHEDLCTKTIIVALQWAREKKACVEMSISS